MSTMNCLFCATIFFGMLSAIFGMVNYRELSSLAGGIFVGVAINMLIFSIQNRSKIKKGVNNGRD